MAYTMLLQRLNKMRKSQASVVAFCVGRTSREHAS
jgi:hypothetical protein